MLVLIVNLLVLMADLLIQMTISGLPTDLFASKSIDDVEMKALNQK